MNIFYELNPVLQSLLACIFTFLITTFGSASVFLFKKVNKTLLDSFLSFSAGVMIAATFFSLINPAINMSTKLNLTPIYVLLVGILGGTLLLFVGDKVFEKKMKLSTERKRISLLIFSITLHNIPEDCVRYVSQKRSIILVNIIKQKKSLLDFILIYITN